MPTAKSVRRTTSKKRPRRSPSPTHRPSDHCVTLGQLKHIMRRFVAERQWAKYHTPRNLAASIAVEAGELLELFQWLTPEEAATRCSSDPAFRQAVGMV